MVNQSTDLHLRAVIKVVLHMQNQAAHISSDNDPTVPTPSVTDENFDLY